MKKLTNNLFKVIALVLVLTFTITLVPSTTVEAATKTIKTSGKGMGKPSTVKKTGTYEVFFNCQDIDHRISPETVKFVAPKNGTYKISFTNLYIKECDKDTYEGMCFCPIILVNGTKIWKTYDKEYGDFLYDPEGFCWKQTKERGANLVAKGYKAFNKACGGDVSKQYTTISCSKKMKKGDCLYFITWGAEDRTNRAKAPTLNDACMTHVTMKVEKTK